MCSKDELVELELDREAIRYILANPGQKYDLNLLQRVFPPAGQTIMNNFGIASERVAKLADDSPISTFSNYIYTYTKG